MRRLRDVSWSIFSARLSLSAMSSSTELDAVLASTPSFLRRSMTSWLGRFRSLASWKTLTFPIRLTPLRPVRHALRGGFGRLGRFGLLRLLGLGLLFGQTALFFRLLRGQPLRLDALGLGPRRFLRVLLVPFRLGGGGGLADLLRRLGADAFDLLQVLVRHLEDVGEPGHARVDQALRDLVAHPV